MPRTGLLANVVAAKKYDPWWLTQPGDHVEIHDGRPVIVPPAPEQTRTLSRVRVVGPSLHGITQQPPPGLSPETWVAETAGALITRQAGLEPQEPPWAWHPAYTIIPTTRPTLVRLHPKACPCSRLAVLASHLGTGRAVTPWHPSLDIWKADWRDPETRSSVHLYRAGIGAAEGPLGMLPATYTTVVAKTRRTPERTHLTHQGLPCGPASRGTLQPAPTTATGVALIGKESRRWRDGRGILELPARRQLAPNPHRTPGTRRSDRGSRTGRADRHLPTHTPIPAHRTQPQIGHEDQG